MVRAGRPLPLPERIARWAAEQGLGVCRVEPLTGDVSLRRYFRVHLAGGGSTIVAHYPPQLRPVCRRYRLTTALLDEAGVPVPRVQAADCRRGLMLLSDNGQRTLYEERLAWPELAPIYRQATDHVLRIQRLPRQQVAALNPPLDPPLLRWELRKSWELLLEPEGLVGPPAVAVALGAAFDALCGALGAAAELVPCHRDFMPRNLMLQPDGRLLVLDHQDVRLGPRAYDLASLLNDSLFPPAELEAELLAELLASAGERLAYRRAVVQRSVKAVGNYVDFAHRGFARHLPLVAPTLARAWRWMPQVPELAPLVPALRPRWEAFVGAHLLD